MHNIEEKQGYKFTEEFDYIPEDWDVAKIKDKSEVKTGGTPNTSISEYWNGNIKWMSSGELNNKRIYDVVGRITEIGLNNSSANMIPKNSILIGLAGQGKTRGTAAINYVDLSTNQSIAAILPSKYFNSEFLYQCIDKRYEELRELSSGGGGRGGLNKTLIMNLPILLPPLPEQEKIAEVLSDIDELIESTQKLIDKKKDLKTATMQKLLTPKPHWVAKKLGEIVKLQGGYSFSSTNFKNVGIPIVRISNIYNNLVILEDDIVYHDEIDLSSCFIINKNDILIAMSGATTGKIGLYCYDNIAYLNQRVGKFIIIDETITNKLFLLQLLKDWKFETLLKKEIAQGAQPNVSSAQIEKMEFMVPISYTEQQKIAQTLSDMDAEIEALEKELNKYKDLKTGMMQELLTGKKRLV